MLEVLEYPNVENNIKYERRITPCLLTNHNLINLFRQRIIGRELHRVHLKLYPLDMQTKILSLNLIPKSKPKPHIRLSLHIVARLGVTQDRHTDMQDTRINFLFSSFHAFGQLKVSLLPLFTVRFS